jgi:transposase-like protein
MSTHRKTWSIEDKQRIISYSKEHGVAKASREFEVSTASIHTWINTFSESNEKESKYSSSKVNLSEYHRLMRENKELKELVAEKELALKIKDALLKKSQSRN